MEGSADDESDDVDLEADAEPADIDSWRDQLLQVLKAMEPDAFERLAQRLMREAGFTNVTCSGEAGTGASTALAPTGSPWCPGLCTSNASGTRAASAPRLSATSAEP